MINSQKLKTVTIISFLIIIFPGPHVTFFNFMLLIIILLQPFFSIGVDSINLYAIQSLLLSGASILSLILIFKKSRLLTLACILIQYLWLFHILNKKNLNDVYYLSTLGLYLLLSLGLIMYLVKRNSYLPKQ